MYAEAALRIELHRGLQVSVLEVQDDRALIGSGAHCDLRLSPDEAAVEQLSLEAIGDEEVYARARTLSPQCLLNGAPFIEGRLLPASMLELGTLALCVTRVARQDHAQRSGAPRKSTTSPAVQALGLLGVAIGLWLVLSPQPRAASAIADVMLPPPAAAEAPVPCPLTDAVGAGAMARQSLLDAQSLRERAPFYPGDGVAAARQFMRAAACFNVAVEREVAAGAQQAARALQVQAADAVHVGHVRLERFIAQRDLAAARHQAQLLAELLADDPDAHGYVQWLSAVKRECELSLEEKAP